MVSQFVGSSPAAGSVLAAWGLPGILSLSLSLSLSLCLSLSPFYPSPTLTVSLKINKLKKKVIIKKMLKSQQRVTLGVRVCEFEPHIGCKIA